VTRPRRPWCISWVRRPGCVFFGASCWLCCSGWVFFDASSWRVFSWAVLGPRRVGPAPVVPGRGRGRLCLLSSLVFLAVLPVSCVVAVPVVPRLLSSLVFLAVLPVSCVVAVPVVPRRRPRRHPPGLGLGLGARRHPLPPPSCPVFVFCCCCRRGPRRPAWLLSLWFPSSCPLPVVPCLPVVALGARRPPRWRRHPVLVLGLPCRSVPSCRAVLVLVPLAIHPTSSCSVGLGAGGASFVAGPVCIVSCTKKKKIK
jgi:hypothetical protein